MDLNQHILAVVEPAIEPTEVAIVDITEEEKGGEKQTKTVGAVIPSIQLNGYVFGDKDIESCIINMEDKVPSVTMKLADRNKAFGSDFTPRDGDCVTVFINSKNVDTFKTVHMDFEILDISSETTLEDGYPEITVRGNAKIPRLFAEVCKEYPNGTSLDHLELIARDLKLGLATNIDATDDSMQRLQTYTPTSDFIQNIVDTSYVSDNAFQRYYIDQYYYLNFIEVNRIFNSENSSLEDLQDSFMTLASSIAENPNTDETEDNVPTKLILSNHSNARGTSNYIGEYKLKNNSSAVSLANGYERNVSYYDNNTPDEGSKLLEFTIEAQTSENMTELEEPLKGRRGEDDYKEQVKFKYMGRMNAGDDGLGNVHSNSLYTELNNVQNNAELNKMKLDIVLEEFNPTIYKYQKVPVLIYAYDPQKIEAMKAAKEAKEKKGFKEAPIKGSDEGSVTNDENPNQMVDTFLSGYYVIENINYKYTMEDGMIQEVTLLRREWPSRLAGITEENMKKDAAAK